MRYQKREIFDALLMNLVDQHCCCRCYGFKPNGKEDDLFAGVRLSNFKDIQGRIHDANIAALGFHDE